jgi:hypothetical protein
MCTYAMQVFVWLSAAAALSSLAAHRVTKSFTSPTDKATMDLLDDSSQDRSSLT